MITIASESNYAHSLTFDSIEAVEAEAADCSRYASRADYPSDIAYIANLLDLPESHVRVEEVITLTRSQLRKLEADMARLVSEVFIDTRWTPPTPPLAVGDVIETEEQAASLPLGTIAVTQGNAVFRKVGIGAWQRVVGKAGPFADRFMAGDGDRIIYLPGVGHDE